MKLQKSILAILLVFTMLIGFIPAQSHAAEAYNVTGAQLILGEALGAQIFTDVPYASDVRATFALNGRTLTAAANNAGGKCAFKVDNVVPDEMAMPITFTCGELTKTFTLYQIAVATLNTNGFSDETYELISDLLRYGDAAAAYRNKPGVLKDDNGTHFVQKTLAAPPETDRILTESPDASTGILGFNFYFNNYNQFCVVVKTTDKSGVKVVMNGKTYSGDALEDYQGMADTYVVYSDPIPARYLGQTFAGGLLKNDAELQRYEYSVQSYAYAVGHSATATGTGKNLAYSLYYYARSVENYVGSGEVVDPGEDLSVYTPMVGDMAFYSFIEVKSTQDIHVEFQVEEMGKIVFRIHDDNHVTVYSLDENGDVIGAIAKQNVLWDETNHRFTFSEDPLGIAAFTVNDNGLLTFVTTESTEFGPIGTNVPFGVDAASYDAVEEFYDATGWNDEMRDCFAALTEDIAMVRIGGNFEAVPASELPTLVKGYQVFLQSGKHADYLNTDYTIKDVYDFFHVFARQSYEMFDVYGLPYEAFLPAEYVPFGSAYGLNVPIEYHDETGVPEEWIYIPWADMYYVPDYYGGLLTIAPDSDFAGATYSVQTGENLYMLTGLTDFTATNPTGFFALTGHPLLDFDLLCEPAGPNTRFIDRETGDDITDDVVILGSVPARKETWECLSPVNTTDKNGYTWRSDTPDTTFIIQGPNFTIRVPHDVETTSIKAEDLQIDDVSKYILYDDAFPPTGGSISYTPKYITMTYPYDRLRCAITAETASGIEYAAYARTFSSPFTYGEVPFQHASLSANGKLYFDATGPLVFLPNGGEPRLVGMSIATHDALTAMALGPNVRVSDRFFYIIPWANPNTGGYVYFLCYEDLQFGIMRVERTFTSSELRSYILAGISRYPGWSLPYPTDDDVMRHCDIEAALQIRMREYNGDSNKLFQGFGYKLIFDENGSTSIMMQGYDEYGHHVGEGNMYIRLPYAGLLMETGVSSHLWYIGYERGMDGYYLTPNSKYVPQHIAESLRIPLSLHSYFNHDRDYYASQDPINPFEVYFLPAHPILENDALVPGLRTDWVMQGATNEDMAAANLFFGGELFQLNKVQFFSEDFGSYTYIDGQYEYGIFNEHIMPFKFTLGQTVEEWLWAVDGTSITDPDSAVTYHYSVTQLTGKKQLRIDALNEYVLFEIPDSLLSHVIHGDGSDAELLHGTFFSLGGDT